MNAKTFFSDRPIAYHPIIAKVCGSVTAAIFLSQIAYWSDKGAAADGWIWKTREEMTDETGLSRSEQETARRTLREFGILKEQVRGVPARLWYLIDWERLEYLLDSYTPTSRQESRQLEGQKPTNREAETLPTIQRLSETTPETTTTKESVAVVAAVPPVKKEKEPEPDRKIALTFQLYQQQIGIINPRLAELVREDIEDIPLEWIPLAFDRAAAANANKWAYVKGTLQNWKAQGGPQDRKNESANAPPVDPSLYRHEDWVKLQGAPGETVEQTFDRLKKQQRIPSNAILRRSNHNGRISQNQ